MPFVHEVKINWDHDPYGENAVDWLAGQKYRPERDWVIDMHAGKLGHTSFWFSDINKALLFKLTMAG